MKFVVGSWLRSTVAERRYFPVLRSTYAADGWPLDVAKPSAACQPTRPTQPFILSRSINE